MRTQENVPAGSSKSVKCPKNRLSSSFRSLLRYREIEKKKCIQLKFVRRRENVCGA